MRIIAILATYNEERFIVSCLEHYINNNIEVYLIDNESTDNTVEYAKRFWGRGLIGIETLKRENMFSLRKQLKRKEELADTLSADWFLHIDTDEFFVPNEGNKSLKESIEEVDSKGFNAINFMECAFVPTHENPDHDHEFFHETMRYYYPFCPSFPHRIIAWKKKKGSVELVRSGGHRVYFPDLRIYPDSFVMKHYLFLSEKHFIEKFENRIYDNSELKDGWHYNRLNLRFDSVALPREDELYKYVSDSEMNISNPREKHFFER